MMNMIEQRKGNTMTDIIWMPNHKELILNIQHKLIAEYKISGDAQLKKSVVEAEIMELILAAPNNILKFMIFHFWNKRKTILFKKQKLKEEGKKPLEIPIVFNPSSQEEQKYFDALVNMNFFQISKHGYQINSKYSMLHRRKIFEASYQEYYNFNLLELIFKKEAKKCKSKPKKKKEEADYTEFLSSISMPTNRDLLH